MVVFAHVENIGVSLIISGAYHFSLSLWFYTNEEQIVYFTVATIQNFSSLKLTFTKLLLFLANNFKQTMYTPCIFNIGR